MTEYLTIQLLLLTKFTGKAPGTRYRHSQYLPYLKNQGFNVTESHLINDTYLDSLYSNKSPILQIYKIMTAYVNRLIRLLNIKQYDVLWIQFELLPFIPFWIEHNFFKKIQYVVEYDDAVFHTYDLNPNPLVKWLLREKIDKVMQNAAIVIAGNQYIADRAIKAGAKQVEIIPTVIDLEKYSLKQNDDSGKFTIGWIGSFSTTKYLNQIIDVTTKYSGSDDVEFTAIGATEKYLLDKNIEVKAWNSETEVEEIKKLDVGIMPLEDTPYTRGKCGFKLIQYMACGLPVIASPVGVNIEIVEHGINGFLATTNEEWLWAIETLKNDPDLRKKMGEAARKKVERQYCLQVTQPKIARLLTQVAQSKYT